MKVEQVKKRYKDEWILAEVLESDRLNKPVEVKLLKHSKNRDEVYDSLESVETGTHVCTFYAGAIPAKGYAVALWSRE